MSKQYKSSLNKLIKSENGSQHLQPPTPISASLRQIIPSIKKQFLLDVGCGGGNQLIEFTSAVGLDLSFENLNKLKGLKKPLCCADVNHGLPFNTSTFDIVLASHILEHIVSPLSLLKEAYRVLKPNGLFIVGVPLEVSFFRIITKDDYFQDHDGHLYAFSPAGLRRLVNVASFKIDELMFDIPLARRLNSTGLQKIGNLLLPNCILKKICANFWIIAKKLGISKNV